MGAWRDLLGTPDRRPFRARLWPWGVCAGFTVLSAALTAWLLMGTGSAHPDRERNVALFAMLPLALTWAVYTVLAWRCSKR